MLEINSAVVTTDFMTAEVSIIEKLFSCVSRQLLSTYAPELGVTPYIPLAEPNHYPILLHDWISSSWKLLTETLQAYPFSMEFLTEVSRRIVNEVEGISLVTYNVTSKPPGTIELQ